ncbi:MAG: hypothetical protein GY913_11070 [Proteobacteria bacterium]|nr:hypothetical protein [Pseudomonadota bacterium]MCP4917455.1 hypothetical protein [Pseudomonadota bacterium]
MVLLLTLACSEYGFVPDQDVLTPGEDAGFEPDPYEPTAGCETFDSGWTWAASDALWESDDPADADGVAFYDVDYADALGSISLPDAHQVPPGADRAYRAVVPIEAVPGVLVDIQSDDGLWLWVNGEEVGHWGGDWQTEGCVNDEANCLEYVTVDPIDITPYLVDGDNIIAARVSNAIEGSWFDLVPTCVD